MADDRGDRPVLPDLALPPDPDLRLPDLVGTSRPPVRPASEYRPLGPPRRVQPPVREREEDRPLPPLAKAVALAVPHLMVAVIAFVPTGLLGVLPIGSLPISLLLMVASQVAAWWVGKTAEAPPLARIGLMNVVTIGVALPMLAIHASVNRIPYVSADLGTATAAIIATVAAVAAIVGTALFAVGIAWDAPEQASLLFGPAAFLVPELLGAPFEPEVREITRRLAEVYLLAAMGAFLSGLVPAVARALISPASLGLLFVGLWAAGRGPTVQRTSGDIVRILDGSLLVVTVILTVAVPVLAIGVGRVAREMNFGDPLLEYGRGVPESWR